MLGRSIKSVCSIHSVKTDDTDDTQADEAIPSFVFEELLPYVCKKFNCDFEIFVKKDYIRDEFHRFKKSDTPLKLKRLDFIIPTRYQKKKQTVDYSSTIPPLDEDVLPVEDPRIISLTGLYDNNDRLVEILLYNLNRVPRLVMQAIALVAPIYQLLTKITIHKCKIDVYTITELSNVVSMMRLTDVCLDDSFLPEANYAILLDKTSNLRQLSLCRCWINDVVCERIVSKLHFLASAERHLKILNLSGNHITDTGAKYISEMLRSNRCLRYLNLAGNQITDKGASYIIDALKEFRLKYEEMAAERKRLLTYLKKKQKLVLKFMTQCDLTISASSRDTGKSSNRTPIKKSSSHSLKTGKPLGSAESKVRETGVSNLETRQRKAYKLASQLLGQLHDPFGPERTVIKNGWPYCKGNLILSYLNLSYNHLTYFTVRRVLAMLLDQNSNSDKESGLMKIVLEGNLLPKTCPEYTEISSIMNKKLCLPQVTSLATRSARSSLVTSNKKKASATARR